MRLHHSGYFMVVSCVVTQWMGSVPYGTPFLKKRKTVYVYSVPRASTVQSYIRVSAE